MNLFERRNDGKPARTYEVQPNGHAQLRVILGVGDQAHAVTPWHTATNALILSAPEIARDCDMPVGEVIARSYRAESCSGSGDRGGARECSAPELAACRSHRAV